MKNLFPILIALATSLSSGAQTTNYELNVGEFNVLTIADGINVDYECNPTMAGMVNFATTPELSSEIIFEPSKDGKLEVKLASRQKVYQNLPTVKVYSSYLTRVENQGDSTVRVISVAPGPRFQAKVMGNGRLVVRDVQATTVDASILTGHGMLVIYGKCNLANLSVTGGAAKIQADELEAVDVKCRLWGTGSIWCYPTQSLGFSGAGTGTVYYRGNPTIKNRAAKVKVESLDAPQQ